MQQLLFANSVARFDSFRHTSCLSSRHDHLAESLIPVFRRDFTSGFGKRSYGTRSGASHPGRSHRLHHSQPAKSQARRARRPVAVESLQTVLACPDSSVFRSDRRSICCVLAGHDRNTVLHAPLQGDDPLAKPLLLLPKQLYYASGTLFATGVNWLGPRMERSARFAYPIHSVRVFRPHVQL